MSYAQLEAAYVAEACAAASKAIEDTPRDYTPIAGNIVKRLQRLARAASSGPHASKVITMTDEEFQLIAEFWDYP